MTEALSVDLLHRYSDYGSKEYDSWYGDDEFSLTAHTIGGRCGAAHYGQRLKDRQAR